MREIVYQLMLFCSLPVLVYIFKTLINAVYKKIKKIEVDKNENGVFKGFFYWIGLKRVENPKKIIFPTIVCFLSSIAVMLIPIFILIHFQLLDFSLFKMNGSAGKGLSLSIIGVALLEAWIKTAFAEEIFFRGFVGKVIQRKFGFLAGLIGQGILFGLPHGLPLILTGGSVVSGVVLIGSAMTAGIFQFYLNEKFANGSILPSIVVHGMINTISFISQI